MNRPARAVAVLLVFLLASCGGRHSRNSMQTPASAPDAAPPPFIARYDASLGARVGDFTVFALGAHDNPDKRLLASYGAALTGSSSSPTIEITTSASQTASGAYFAVAFDPAKYHLASTKYDGALGSEGEVLFLAIAHKSGIVGIGAVRIGTTPVQVPSGSPVATITFGAGPMAVAKRPSAPIIGDTSTVPYVAVTAPSSLPVLTWRERDAGDYDADGTVGITDLQPLAAYYGEKTATSSNPALTNWIDALGSGELDITDLQPVAENYTGTLVGYRVYTAPYNAGVPPVFTPLPSVSAPVLLQRTGATSIANDPALEYTYTDTAFPGGTQCYRVVPYSTTDAHTGTESLTCVYPLNAPTGNTSVATAAAWDPTSPVSGTVTPPGTADAYFKITSGGNGQLKIRLGYSFQTGVNLKLYVYNSALTLVGSDESLSQLKTVRAGVAAGIYYVKVSASGGASDFLLNADLTGAPSPWPSPEPNNDFFHATPIQLGQSYIGKMTGGQDLVDYYRLPVTVQGSLVVTLRYALSASLALEIYTSAGALIHTANTVSTSQQTFTAVLPPDNYYLVVRASGIWDNAWYTITTAFTPGSGGGGWQVNAGTFDLVRQVKGSGASFAVVYVDNSTALQSTVHYAKWNGGGFTDQVVETVTVGAGGQQVFSLDAVQGSAATYAAYAYAPDGTSTKVRISNLTTPSDLTTGTASDAIRSISLAAGLGAPVDAFLGVARTSVLMLYTHDTTSGIWTPTTVDSGKKYNLVQALSATRVAFTTYDSGTLEDAVYDAQKSAAWSSSQITAYSGYSPNVPSISAATSPNSDYFLSYAVVRPGQLNELHAVSQVAGVYTDTLAATVGRPAASSAAGEVSLAFTEFGAPVISFADLVNHKLMAAEVSSKDSLVTTLQTGTVDGFAASSSIAQVGDLESNLKAAYAVPGDGVYFILPTAVSGEAVPSTIGQTVSATSVAFDPMGTPWVACAVSSVGSAAVVARYNGFGWTDTTVASSTGTVDDVKIGFDTSGTPTVVYRETLGSGNQDITMLQYGGTSWTSTPVVSPANVLLGGLSLDFDMVGRPIVSYSKRFNPGSGNKYDVFFSRFNGSSFAETELNVTPAPASLVRTVVRRSQTLPTVYVFTMNDSLSPRSVVQFANPGAGWSSTNPLTPPGGITPAGDFDAFPLSLAFIGTNGTDAGLFSATRAADNVAFSPITGATVTGVKAADARIFHDGGTQVYSQFALSAGAYDLTIQVGAAPWTTLYGYLPGSATSFTCGLSVAFQRDTFGGLAYFTKLQEGVWFDRLLFIQ